MTITEAPADNTFLEASNALASDIDIRKSLYRIDAQVAGDLHELWPVTKAMVSRAVEEFWQDVSKVPRRKKLFEENRDRIRRCEVAHFEILMSGRFDERYLASCIDTAREELMIGMDVAARICAGNILFSSCATAIAATHRWNSSRVARYTTAVAHALAFDLGNAIVLHTEAIAVARERKRKIIEEEIAKFGVAIGSVIDAIKEASVSLTKTSGIMQQTANETRKLMLSASAASQETSEGVAMTASAASQLSGTIQEIGHEARCGLEQAQAAVSETERARDSIRQLADAAQRIGSVVSVISKIAAQTNLLALNASIEATRAGQAGKGFSVVAQEIKLLATQTSTATQDISQQVSTIQTATKLSVDEMASMGEVMNRVASAVTNIAVAVEQQGLATQDIMGHAQSSAANTASVAEEIRSVEDATTRAVTAAQEIGGWTRELSTRASDLESQVESFFMRVRAV